MKRISIFTLVLLCIAAIILPPLAFVLRVVIDEEEYLLAANLVTLFIAIGLTLVGWLPGSP